ncbi:hypothetical protein MalM25_03390 [Planctomycetes bacterium MalM25]|nr:hypothetical protein MalM25_03390 [Planctomycetes bacterium MalM25]
MLIEGGASVSNTDGYIAARQYRGTVIVTGTDSTWINNNALRMGSFPGGNKGELIIEAGGRVSSTDMSMSNGSIVKVSGTDSLLEITGLDFSIGNGGSGASGEFPNSLAIEAGGRVVSPFTHVRDASLVTVTGTGSTWAIDDFVSFEPGSKLLVADGGQVEVTTTGGVGGLNLGSQSLISISGGTLSTREIFNMGGTVDFVHGALNLTDSGLVVGSSGLLGESVNIPSNSSIGVSQAVTVDANAELIVDGSLSSSNIANNGHLALISTVLDQPLVSPAGSTIDVIGDVTFSGLVSGAGNIFGSGTVTFNGGYSPGDSPALVTVENGAAFGGANTLFMELGGVMPGAEHDALDVAGTLAVDGTLEVSLVNAYAPSAGDSFDLLDFGSLTGAFDAVNLPALTGGMSWDQSQLHTDGVLRVLSSIAGDYNNDGLVDAADYTVWRDNEGAPAGTLPNDADGGVIGTAQYDTWRNNYGDTLPALSNAVPEPGGLVLCLAALAPARRRR